MVALFLGRAIIVLVILSPIIAFVVFGSTTSVYHKQVAFAAADEASTTSPIGKAVRIVTYDKHAEEKFVQLYEQLPEMINGFPKPPLEEFRIVYEVSKKKDFDWRTLYAIWVVESGCGVSIYGDEGHSIGPFQINDQHICEYNGNKPGCMADADRYDTEKSAVWTINRLLQHEHLGEYEMIRSHNGRPADNSNAAYVKNVRTYRSLLP